MTDTPEWKPTATIADLKVRSQLIQSIRNFFNSRHYLEVDTPSMGPYGVTDCYLYNIEVYCNGNTQYLQTSPEYYMKRLLAAGSGPVFQIGHAFRDQEKGRWHQPEFTMLEFYQEDVDHLQLISIISELFQHVCQWLPIETVTYQEVFQQYCYFNPHQTNVTQLQQCLSRYGLDSALSSGEEDIDQYLFLLMTEVIEPQLADKPMPIAITDFPKSQAALATVTNEKAHRFEIYFKGIELANGFQELTDPEEQLTRFEYDNYLRKQQNKIEKAIDPYFLAALRYGLPSCSGVAIGIDRLVALCLGHHQIKSVMSFAQP